MAMLNATLDRIASASNDKETQDLATAVAAAVATATPHLETVIRNLRSLFDNVKADPTIGAELSIVLKALFTHLEAIVDPPTTLQAEARFADWLAQTDSVAVTAAQDYFTFPNPKRAGRKRVLKRPDFLVFSDQPKRRLRTNENGDTVTDVFMRGVAVDVKSWGLKFARAGEGAHFELEPDWNIQAILNFCDATGMPALMCIAPPELPHIGIVVAYEDLERFVGDEERRVGVFEVPSVIVKLLPTADEPRISSVEGILDFRAHATKNTATLEALRHGRLRSVPAGT